MSVEALLRARLIARDGFPPVVMGLPAPSESARPLVWVRRLGGRAHNMGMGGVNDEVEHEVSVGVVADTPASLVSVRDAIREELDGAIFGRVLWAAIEDAGETDIDFGDRTLAEEATLRVITRNEGE